jgi:hypothetical protein
MLDKPSLMNYDTKHDCNQYNLNLIISKKGEIRIMIIQDTVKGSELNISNGSHVFRRDEEGNETFKEWSELDQDTQMQLSELAGKAEGIMLEAKETIGF